MERLGGGDIAGNWITFSGIGQHLDADGGVVPGTPGGPNSPFLSTPTPTARLSPSATMLATATPQPTATRTASPTPSPSSTPSSSPSPTPTATAPSTAVPAQSILINEVAWAGTQASAFDEWIELHNPGSQPIPLDGWTLTDGDDLVIPLRGALAPYSFFLLERTDDSVVASRAADLIYTGSLRNSGESLTLRDPSGVIVDSANHDGGPWPAGESATRATMERLGGGDIPGNWTTFTGYGQHTDAEGNPIPGTPAGLNSPFLATPTASPTPTSTPSPELTPIAPQRVLINEIAWAGTLASSSDEWIELHNPADAPVGLEGWRLTDHGDLSVPLAGTIPPFGYFLLERGDDGTVQDLAADVIYTGTLRNAGETLTLYDPTGARVDTANADGGSWPAGEAASRGSMERRGGDDHPGNWGTYTGYGGRGVDSAGQPIQGSPKALNSVLVPTPTPTWIPGQVVINEVLIRPHYDWEGTGGVTPGDEFIELYNRGPNPVFLKGWYLDDVAGGGSRPFELPGVTISPDGFAYFFRSTTHVTLNDSGDTVRLMAPNGGVVDEISYLRVRAYNLSYGRLPDGSNSFAYGLWPTPGEANLIFVAPTPEVQHSPPPGFACQGGSVLWTRLPRQSRQPALRRWMDWIGLGVCR